MRSITSLLAAGLLACSMSAIAADDRASDNVTDGRNSDMAAADDGANSSSADRRNNEVAANDRDTGIAPEGRSAGKLPKNEGSVVRDGTPVAEYGNECAWGLANGKHVQTNCSINMTGSNGKTYCFSSDQAMTSFMKDPSRNMSKSKETFGRS